MLELLFNKVADLEACNFIKMRLQHIYFEEHLRTATSVLLIIELVISIGHLPTSHLNQKHNVGWFLLRRFKDLVRVYSLLIISRKPFQHVFID